MQLECVLQFSSSALTQVAVSQQNGYVMETMTVETGLMNKTVAVNTITVYLLLHYYVEYYLCKKNILFCVV